MLAGKISRRRFVKAGALLVASLPFLGSRCREGDVSNGGVRTHYTVDGDGPPLLLHHGFLGSSEDWRENGYIDALSPRFQVIAIDARGHGQSDKPHDPAQYTMKLRTGDVASVLDELSIDKVNYWGYSMGARTGFAFAQYHSDRLLSLIIGAASPTSPKLEETRIRRGAEALRAHDLAGVAAAFNVSEQAAAIILEGNDFDAAAAAQLGLLSWNGVEPSSLTVGSLLYAGDRDWVMPATRAAAAAMPNGRFQLLAGLNHLTGFTRSESALAAVVPFLAR